MVFRSIESYNYPRQFGDFSFAGAPVIMGTWGLSLSNVVEFSGAGLVIGSRTNSELNGDI